jgi:hypothetical protein
MITLIWSVKFCAAAQCHSTAIGRQAKLLSLAAKVGGGHFVRFVAKARSAVVAAVGASTFSSKAQTSNRKLDSRQNMAEMDFFISLHAGEDAFWCDSAARGASWGILWARMDRAG